MLAFFCRHRHPKFPNTTTTFDTPNRIDLLPPYISPRVVRLQPLPPRPPLIFTLHSQKPGVVYELDARHDRGINFFLCGHPEFPNTTTTFDTPNRIGLLPPYISPRVVRLQPLPPRPPLIFTLHSQKPGVVYELDARHDRGINFFLCGHPEFPNTTTTFDNPNRIGLLPPYISPRVVRLQPLPPRPPLIFTLHSQPGVVYELDARHDRGITFFSFWMTGLLNPKSS